MTTNFYRFIRMLFSLAHWAAAIHIGLCIITIGMFPIITIMITVECESITAFVIVTALNCMLLSIAGLEEDEKIGKIYDWLDIKCSKAA